MSLIDLLISLVSTVLRVILWAVAALAALVVVSLGLVALLAWLGVNLLLGRKPHLAMRGRFQDLRQFRGAFGPAGFKASGLWPRPAPEQTQPGNPAAGPLARRIPSPGTVVDVESRDLPGDRQGS